MRRALRAMLVLLLTGGCSRPVTDTGATSVSPVPIEEPHAPPGETSSPAVTAEVPEAEVNPEILAKLKNIIVEQLGVDEAEVQLDSHLIDDLGADSLDVVELIMACEEEFGIEIPDEQAEKWTTVRSIAASIEETLEAPRG